MKKNGRGCSVLPGMLVLLMLLGIPVSAADHHHYTEKEVYQVIEEILQWKKQELGVSDEENLLNERTLDFAGDEIGDLYVLCLARYGSEGDYLGYLSVANEVLQERADDSESEISELQRICLTYAASGGNLMDVGEAHQNFIERFSWQLEEREQMTLGLLLADSLCLQIPENASVSRDEMIEGILALQLADGGFATEGESAQVETTALVVTALAPYYNSEQEYYYTRESTGATKTGLVRDAIEEALICLAGQDARDTAGISAKILALSSLGLDVQEDRRFLDGKVSLLDQLFALHNEDGGFAPLGEGAESDDGAGAKALRALIAYVREQEGLRNFYDFRQEQPDSLRTQIRHLNRDMERLEKSEVTMEKVQALYERYLEVPVEERSAVRFYGMLEENMQDFGMANESEPLSPAMERNTSAAGIITDIRNPDKMISVDIVFGAKEERRVRTLIRKHSLEYAVSVQKAIYQMERNGLEGEELYGELKALKEETEETGREIDAINQEIAEELYPFDQIGIRNKAAVDDILKRCENLNDYEKSLVEHYDGVVKAGEKLEEEMHRMTVYGIGSAIVLFLAVLLVIFGKMIKTKKHKKQQE